MNEPLCSVVMPLFNKEREVRSAVASVLAQSFEDFELLVVNDGSTDCSRQIVQELRDARIVVINQENGGVSAARNTGIQLARAGLIAFIDADDLWHVDFLATIVSLHTDFPQAQWFATGYEIRHPVRGRFVSKLRGAGKDFQRGILPDYFSLAICSDPPVWSSATGVMRDAIQVIGGFPVGIGSGEDLLTWAQLAVRFPLAYEARSLAVFRVSDTHRRADHANRVGNALRQLVEEFPTVPSLREYLGLWYRIEAVMAMRFGETALARQRARQAVRYGPWQLRNAYTLLLALLPPAWQRGLDKKVRGLLKQKQKAQNPVA